MKLVKRLSLFVVAIAFVLTLASCGKISQKYADKVNKAAEKGEPLTFTEVKEDLGDEAVWIGTGEKIGAASGVIIAVKGCTTVDDIKAKLDEGKTVKGITVTVLLNKATAAKYTEITAEDLK